MATASNTQRTPRDVIEFAPNVPVTLALKYNQGKLIAGQYGERMMFTTTDGRIMFLHPATAGQIEAAGINVRESFTITKTMGWRERLAHDVGNRASRGRAAQRHVRGTSAAGSGRYSEAARVGQRRNTQRRAIAAGARGRFLVDAYALVLERALTTYQGRIKPDEVRSLLLSAYIQRRQLLSAA